MATLEVHWPAGPAGLADYAATVAAMDRAVERPKSQPDALWLLQHPVVATLGRRGGRHHLQASVFLNESGETLPLPVHEVARGGDVTMHAPGQLVGYPLVQLAALEGPLGRGPLGDLPLFVRTLERELAAVCQQFGVATELRAGQSGVWRHGTGKLASIGVAVRNGWSFHGFALNVDPDLRVFAAMVPCGIAGAHLTSLGAELRGQGKRVPSVAEVGEVVGERLRAVLVRRPATPPVG